MNRAANLLLWVVIAAVGLLCALPQYGSAQSNVNWPTFHDIPWGSSRDEVKRRMEAAGFEWTGDLCGTADVWFRPCSAGQRPYFGDMAFVGRVLGAYVSVLTRNGASGLDRIDVQYLIASNNPVFYEEGFNAMTRWYGEVRDYLYATYPTADWQYSPGADISGVRGIISGKEALYIAVSRRYRDALPCVVYWWDSGGSDVRERFCAVLTFSAPSYVVWSQELARRRRASGQGF
jgi:hypothetical protein